MRKQRFAIIALLVAIVSACCVMFVTACDKTPKHSITWTLAPQVTVKAEGYDAPPAELAEGAEISFTLEFENGYELGTISGAKGNGPYTLTMGARDVEIKVTAIKTIASLEVTNPVNEYYAGQKVDAEKVSVKVNYVVGEAVTVTGDQCSIIYQNGDEFSLGDTKYTVKYGKGSKEITLGKAVVGLVTLNLAGGQLSEAGLAMLPTNRVISEDGDTISWTFTEKFDKAMVIPAPTKTTGDTMFDFLRWSGVEKNTIPEGNAVSVTATATYDVKLVNLTSIQILTEKSGEADVPYLVLEGEFMAASEVYLYLYEGNDKVELKGPTITKQGSSSDFVCKFDLRELVAKNYQGKWMDIKLCAQLGTRIETQEIDINNYEDDFIEGKRSISVVLDEKWVTFEYQYHTPKPGDGITGAPGSVYEGTEKLLKINYNVSDIPAFIFTNTTLEVRNELPYLVVKGEGLAAENKEELVELLTDHIKDMQNFSNWNNIDIKDKQVLTVNNDLTFEITLCIDGITESGYYIMHSKDGNFNPSEYDTSVEISVGGLKYSLSKQDMHNWGWSWTCIKCDNAAYGNDKSVIVEGGKPVFVLNGAAAGKTAEEVKALLTRFDFEPDGDSENKVVIDPSKITVTVENDIYTVKVDISELGVGKYWVHAVGLGSGDNGDVHPDASKPAATVNGKTYQGIDETKDWGVAHLLQVSEAQV